MDRHRSPVGNCGRPGCCPGVGSVATPLVAFKIGAKNRSRKGDFTAASSRGCWGPVLRADQEYFADGMVEDITAGLLRIKWLFVIAFNSSFAYKGKAIEVRKSAICLRAARGSMY